MPAELSSEHMTLMSGLLDYVLDAVWVTHRENPDVRAAIYRRIATELQSIAADLTYDG